jgi:hypothetical protein
MTPEQLLENFKTQQIQVMEEIRKLETEIAQKRELYVKLQGAIEGLTLLNPEPEQESDEEPEQKTKNLVTEILE